MMKKMIKLFTGPMFSGKTTRLIGELHRMVLGRKKCLLVRFKGDSRCTLTHGGGVEVPCEVRYVDNNELDEILDLSNYDVVAIDEGQFFSNLSNVCLTLKHRGIVVLIAGLISTFTAPYMNLDNEIISANERGDEVFPEIIKLIPHVDILDKLTAVCTNDCGNDAIYSIRLVSNNEIEVIGGMESYAPRCLSCLDI